MIAALRDNIDAVVIGTSAGGVEALTMLLPALHESSRIAVLIVLHLPRDRPSLLVEIFADRCALPVFEAMDKQPLARGAVYFAPPDYHLLLEAPESANAAPRMALAADEEVHYSRPSVDVLFESAAEVFGRRLLGIVLTGANGDGAAGLAAVHAAGGATVVQDPRTAHSPTMIEAAMGRVTPDHVLSLEQIAQLLGSLQGRA